MLLAASNVSDMMSLILNWRIGEHWELLFKMVLILSKYFMSDGAIAFHMFIPYQITFNKGQYLTHMVLCVCSTKVAAISWTRWNSRKWFCVLCVCWVTAEWQTDWTTLKNTLSIGDKSVATPHARQQDITGRCITVKSLWWMNFDLLFSYTIGKHTHVSPGQTIFMLLIQPWTSTFIIQRRLWSERETSQASNELLQYNKLASDTCHHCEQTQ